MRNFSTFHSHPQSLDSGSTPEAMIKRELELGSGTITATDHGSMAACRKIYDLARQNGLIPILGLEAYFRDDNCPILKAHGIDKPKEYLKYYHVTLHARTQKAYEKLCLKLSHAPVEQHGSEAKPLFNWADLEEIGAEDVTFGSGCLVGMVQRHLLDNGREDIAEAYYDRLKAISRPGNFFVEVFPHVCSHNWVSGVFLEMADGTKLRYYAKKKLRCSHAGEIEAADLAKLFKKPKWNPEETLIGVMNNRKWEDLPAVGIKSVAHIEEFMQNECTPWAPNGDVQLGCNHKMVEFAKKNGDPVLISDDSHYATPDEKIVQDVRLQQSGNWRFFGHYHRQDSQEAFQYFKTHMGVDEKTFESWVDNNTGWAQGFKDFSFKEEISLPTKFYPENTLKHLKVLIDKHGRMDWSNKKYTDRLQAEIKLLHQNGKLDLLPYFFLGEETCAMYEARGMLTGPGRGSAAGLLTSYLLGITHIDPLRFDLSMDRFLTKDRILSGKLPDIDFDFPTREPLVGEDGMSGWLRERFGENYAQISVDTTLKLKSAAKDVARATHGGKVPDDIEALVKKFLVPPQGISDKDFVFGYDGSDGHVPGSIEIDQSLQTYTRRYPREWEIVQKALGLARNKGRHASAFVVTNRPVAEFIPLTKVSGVSVTQYTAGSVEAAGGIKLDFLVINSINDVQDAIKLIQARSGVEIPESLKINGKRVPGIRLVPHNGQLHDIWDLPEDQSVFREVAEGKTETVFQFNTNSARQWLKQFDFWKDKKTGRKAIDSVEAMAAFTALDRPGPLDAFVESPDGSKHNMLVEYARRARGEEAVGGLPVFFSLFPETYGTLTYQEQLQKAFQELTGCTGSEAEEFRINVAKKKMEKVHKTFPFFLERAGAKLGQEQAQRIWDLFVSWGQYGFCKAHSTSYVTISYACAYLKKHFPLEWWCAVLRNANKNEINDKFWRYCGHLILLPDITHSSERFEIEGDKLRAPTSLLHGVGETAHAQLCQYRPYKDIQDFCEKIEHHKESGKTAVLDKVTGEHAKDKKGKLKYRKAHNALTQAIVHKLIVAGVMDSLFPATIDTETGPVPITVYDKLSMYEAAIAKVSGKKKVEKVPDALRDLNRITTFQLRKEVLPVYSESLLPMVASLGRKEISNRCWLDIPILTVEQIQKLAAISPMPRDGIAAACAAYIVSQRVFTYQGSKEACEINLDIDGERMSFVKWPGKDGKLPPFIKEDLSGSIVMATLERYKDRPFAIKSLDVIQKPLKLDMKDQEESEA